MSSQFLRRFTVRPTTGLLRTPLRSARVTPALSRSYAEASPEHSSNVRNPTSSSAESQEVNTSRGMDSASGSPDTASLQTPVTAGEHVSQSEEPTDSHRQMHQDPNKPDEEKRKEVLKEGEKPLDAADK